MFCTTDPTVVAANGIKRYSEEYVAHVADA